MSNPTLVVRSASIQREIESIARSIFSWLEGRCANDPEFAAGKTLERTWTDEITNLLTAQGRTATHQKCYPGSRKSCDVVTTLPEQKELWIEVKGAWLTSQHRTDPDGRVTFLKNLVFRKHLFDPQESTLKDLTEKIPSVVSPEVIGAVVLIAFDSYGCPMDGSIDELITKAELNKTPWGEFYREWQNPHDGKYRIRCWFWYR